MKHVNRLASFTIASGVIGDESETQSRERLEVVALEHVDAGQHLRRAVTFIPKRELLKGADRLAVKSRFQLAYTFDGRSVSHRPRDNRRHAPAQWSNITFTVRMNAIAQKHDEHLTRRIDPERRSGETRVTKRTERKQIATIGRVAGVHVPAKSARRAAAGNDARARHLSNRQRREDPNTAIRAVIQNHLAIDGEIVGSRKESGMAGDAVHAIRSRIVPRTTQHNVPFGAHVR